MYSYPLSTREVTFNMFLWWVAAAAKLLQLCLTLRDPIDGSPPGSPVPGILQARTLEWVPSPSPMNESKKWKWRLSVIYNLQRLHGLQPTRLLHPWDFPAKSTRVGCHCLLRTGEDSPSIKKLAPSVETGFLSTKNNGKNDKGKQDLTNKNLLYMKNDVEKWPLT